jgi:hypothetical protein
MDFDSIPAGVDFREHIMRAIDRSHVVIALIGPDWLGDKTGFRRIDDPDDFVRFEISHALARGIPVIPVLINEAKMPEADELPGDIKELAFRNALPLDSGLDFHSHAERLVDALRAISPLGRRTARAWRHPACLILGVLIGVVAISVVVLIVVGFFRRNPNATAKLEGVETNKSLIATTVSPTPSSSAVTERENIPATSPPAESPSGSPVSIRDFRGRWSSVNTSPLGGNGTLTVADQLIIEEKAINETITTEWISEGTSVFRITLRIRFGELWAFNNQLNARCLAADVVDVADPKEFGKYANMREQTANAAKAGVNLVYTWTLSGTEIRRGGMTWSRQK